MPFNTRNELTFSTWEGRLKQATITPARLGRQSQFGLQNITHQSNCLKRFRLFFSIFIYYYLFFITLNGNWTGYLIEVKLWHMKTCLKQSMAWYKGEWSRILFYFIKLRKWISCRPHWFAIIFRTPLFFYYIVFYL